MEESMAHTLTSKTLKDIFIVRACRQECPPHISEKNKACTSI
jgi:hypothetical protein